MNRVLYLLCDKRLGCLSWMETVHGLDKLVDLRMASSIIIIIIIIISSSIINKLVDLRIKMLSFRVVCCET